MASVGKYVEVGGRRLYQLRTGGIAKGRVDSYKVVGCRGSGGFGAIYTVRRRSDNLLAVLTEPLACGAGCDSYMYKVTLLYVIAVQYAAERALQLRKTAY